MSECEFFDLKFTTIFHYMCGNNYYSYLILTSNVFISLVDIYPLYILFRLSTIFLNILGCRFAI